MRKRAQLFLISLLALTLILPHIVSAATPVENIKSIGSGIFEIIRPLSETILGSTPGGDLLFAKVLLLLMMGAIVWSVLKNSGISFFQNTAIIWILSIGVSILSIRWISAEMVGAILLPYTTLGVAVTALIPFIIFFFIIEVGFRGSPPIFRRISWIAFAVVFIGLWISRYEQLGDESFIYPVTAAIALLMIWADGTIQRFFAGLKIEKEMGPMKANAYAILLKKYEELSEMVSEAKASGDGKRAQRLAGRLGTLHQQLIYLDGR